MDWCGLRRDEITPILRIRIISGGASPTYFANIVKKR
jgi:hypothetical protein